MAQYYFENILLMASLYAYSWHEKAAYNNLSDNRLKACFHWVENYLLENMYNRKKHNIRKLLEFLMKKFYEFKVLFKIRPNTTSSVSKKLVRIK